MIAAYFAAETTKLRDACLEDIQSLDDWKQKREVLRGQLMEMLSLDPPPEKTPLHAQITGVVDHQAFRVENLHFQSRPGLYVTGNLYIPKGLKKPAPTILYVCGHARVKKNGVSYGNKVHYQHHGVWFAEHGYVCLMIDTLQLGEIEGVHHGTYNQNMWWWLDRGYTSAGVEAWNCIRALDYLETREEVDAQRFGVTGRSGGGAYSWWTAALDERIRCAVPVAGITDLQNYVVDGCVEGHCDCMFMVNTHRWDYAQVAALVAPRPLLISNSDRDGIFPLDGVVRVHKRVRKIYELYGKPENLALQITAGPHKDTQELRVHAFRWFNHFLKNDDDLIRKPAEPAFEPEQLQVFRELPKDSLNAKIQETFVAAAAPALPANSDDWQAMRDDWLAKLRQKSFAGWPQDAEPVVLREVVSVVKQGVRLRAYDFESQTHIKLRLYVLQGAQNKQPKIAVLNLLDEAGWREFLQTWRVAFADVLADEAAAAPDEAAFQSQQAMLQSQPWAMAYLALRGVGPTRWNTSERKQTQHRRRFYLLGQSLAGMQIWDARRGVQALSKVAGMQDADLWLQAHGEMAGEAMYVSLFEPDVQRLDLYDLPTSHRDGPHLLNVRRFFDLPQTVALAAEHTAVVIYTHDASPWKYAQEVQSALKWPARQLRLRRPSGPAGK